MDLPSDILRNREAWDTLRQCDVVQKHGIPLPCSNTVVAKQMRLAVILAILAREIDTHIFQPIYIAPMDDRFRKVLTDLAASDTEKESFCRSILLSMDPGIQSWRCSASIRTVVMNVSAYLDELLPKDKRHLFHRSLQQVVQKAADTWKPIQCSRRRYEADFEPAIDDDDWKLFEFPKPDHITAGISTNEKPQPTITLTVFPCLSVLEQQASTAYTTAIRLSSLQYQWTAAQREMAKEPTTTPNIGRAFSCLRKSSNSKSLPSVEVGPKKRNGS
ncbi:hypothetical protein BDV25DRAFT_166266 [Aspergillus avenaceus]|uniref:Uncharacterized protein n=1 Tax=Aspergillus avenaceus TaxID=36643 RepID=A0A5N6TE79_ASPAV|nr:hypothetical protein BDV25DRAFT_166266 [Aspergillus avenaceus]